MSHCRPCQLPESISCQPYPEEISDMMVSVIVQLLLVIWFIRKASTDNVIICYK